LKRLGLPSSFDDVRPFQLMMRQKITSGKISFKLTEPNMNYVSVFNTSRQDHAVKADPHDTSFCYFVCSLVSLLCYVSAICEIQIKVT